LVTSTLTPRDQRHLDGDVAVLEEAFDLRKVDRGVISPTFVHRLPHVRTDEKGIEPELLGEAPLGVWRQAQREDLDDLVVRQVISVVDHGLDQGLGLTAGGAYEHGVAPSNVLDRLLGGAPFVLVLLPPVPVSFSHLRVISPDGLLTIIMQGDRKIETNFI
jgi:hypothetical protein